MVQTESLLRYAVLKWEVIHTDSLGNRWIIAAFNEEDHARSFSFWSNVGSVVGEYSVRENPEWARTVKESERARELHRPVDMTETIEEVES